MDDWTVEEDVMAETPRSYPHGVPCWIELETADIDPALAFYEALFGWALTSRLPADAPGRYVVASLDGTDATALAAIAMPGHADRQGRAEAGWNTYLAVDDVDAAAARVDELGGTVVSPPETVGPPDAAVGRMASIVDPQGAPSRLWQAGSRLGAQQTNGPGMWNFSDLHTPDVGAALRFYGPLLGWEVDPKLAVGMARVPGYGDHLARTSDPDIHERQAGFAPPGFADAVAGVIPTDGPARWSVIFSVEDRDASAEAALAAGGTVVSTLENEWARGAVIRDPQGAEFQVSQFAPQM
jgi:predicted enzyme related to lactoylglutathione lyase